MPVRPHDTDQMALKFVKLCLNFDLRQSRVLIGQAAKVVCRSPGAMKSDFIIVVFLLKKIKGFTITVWNGKFVLTMNSITHHARLPKRCISKLPVLKEKLVSFLKTSTLAQVG